MRIIVAGPPKTGNIWVKHILAEVYGLKNLTPHPRADAGQLKRFVDQGGLLTTPSSTNITGPPAYFLKWSNRSRPG